MTGSGILSLVQWREHYLCVILLGLFEELDEKQHAETLRTSDGFRTFHHISSVGAPGSSRVASKGFHLLWDARITPFSEESLTQ